MIGRYNVTGGDETRLWDITVPTCNYVKKEKFSRGLMDEDLLDPSDIQKAQSEAKALIGGDVIENFVKSV